MNYFHIITDKTHDKNGNPVYTIVILRDKENLTEALILHYEDELKKRGFKPTKSRLALKVSSYNLQGQVNSLEDIIKKFE